MANSDMADSIDKVEKGGSMSPFELDQEVSVSQVEEVPVGREHLSGALPPHESYEGRHRWDPEFQWDEAEERKCVRKTDLFLLSWICVMFFGLQLDRGNIQQALTDDLLTDLNITSNDYNNGTTIQLLCFLAAEFPVQMITKRYGFKKVLPILMMMWSTVSWAQAFITNRATFYVTRALIGACEGGFIPGTILFATYFYKSQELATRLAFFWSTLNVARVISSLLAAGILNMRGIGGKSGWFWLFILEGLLTFLIGLISLLYLPQSPVHTKSILCPRQWYTEREESIMINRLLRDDPAKGLTAIKEPATWADVKEAWSDNSMWGMYFLGLIAYIPATPVQGYLSLTLKRIGFSTFDSNMLSIPSAALQIILMLLLAKSSEFFDERTLHCIIGEFWILPLLAALLALPSGGHAWARFNPHNHDIRVPVLPPDPVGVDLREQLQRQEARADGGDVQRHRAGRKRGRVADLPQGRPAVLLPREQSADCDLCADARGHGGAAGVVDGAECAEREGLGTHERGGARGVSEAGGGAGEGGEQEVGVSISVLISLDCGRSSTATKFSLH